MRLWHGVTTCNSVPYCYNMAYCKGLLLNGILNGMGYGSYRNTLNGIPCYMGVWGLMGFEL